MEWLVIDSACSLSALITVSVFFPSRMKKDLNPIPSVTQYGSMPSNLIFLGIEFLLTKREFLRHMGFAMWLKESGIVYINSYIAMWVVQSGYRDDVFLDILSPISQVECSKGRPGRYSFVVQRKRGMERHRCSGRRDTTRGYFPDPCTEWC